MKNSRKNNLRYSKPLESPDAAGDRAMQQAVAEQRVAVEAISTKGFWQALAPDLHVEDVAYLQGQTYWNLDEESFKALKELIKVKGYFQLPPQQWELPIARMAELIKELERRGLPLPFSFMYDEFWCLFFRLHKLLEGLLGEGYLRLP